MQRVHSADGSAEDPRCEFGRVLTPQWFDRPTAQVARDLLGRVITRRFRTGISAARVVETEAYVANDPANHAFAGQTKRNGSMFGPAGTLYVYRIHQVYCANAVTRPGQAVLLRAAEPITAGLPSLNGPGRLCRGLQLTREHDGWDLTSSAVQLREGDRRAHRVVVGPRLGIRKAAERPLRFAVQGNRWVSTPRPPGWQRAEDPA